MIYCLYHYCMTYLYDLYSFFAIFIYFFNFCSC
nr:MAG TPA: hypothetical protein [Bacteriophage sp.]